MPAKIKTILLVEDNDDDVFLMKRALMIAGVCNPMEVVEDGEQAIEYLGGTGTFADRVRYPYPEIMFLDLKMPRKSGFDVLAWLRLRQDLPRPITVVLSSSNSPADMDLAAKFGATYVVKPPTEDLFPRLAVELNVIWLMRGKESVKLSNLEQGEVKS